MPVYNGSYDVPLGEALRILAQGRCAEIVDEEQDVPFEGLAVNPDRSRFTPEERRRLVALGVQAGKPNRAIARELGVDEGTVRRDRRFLVTPEHERPAKKERRKRPKAPKPMYAVDDHASVIRHKGRVLKAVKHLIEEERMVLNEVEYVLHEAGRQLLQGRELVKGMPIPTKRPEELLLPTRPNTSKWGDFIPNPDYWAEWLARWLAVCLPAQEDLQVEVLRETSFWARSG